LEYNHLDHEYSESLLSRIINYDSAGKYRNRLIRAIVLAVRELSQQTGPGIESRDLAAYISLALGHVAETIEISVAAWEKRGYWVKADKFSMDWMWAGQTAGKLRTAVLAENWDEIAHIATLVAGKLIKITLPARHNLSKPWVGAWNELQK
jgi:hypothetical protein